MGYELNVCKTKYEAECAIADTWQSIVEGRNLYWDANDFECLEANDKGTGFMNVVTIDSDWEV
jgi:hypothetical protein